LADKPLSESGLGNYSYAPPRSPLPNAVTAENEERSDVPKSFLCFGRRGF
jgi:hypothetical protein